MPSSRKSRTPIGSEGWSMPWVQMKYFSFHPCIYPAMLGAVHPSAKAGDWVHVYDKTGQKFGMGLYNPKARVPVRMYHHGPEALDESHFTSLLERAVDWRLNSLNLPATTDAFRAIHSDGDNLSGLVVDRYADVLSMEVHSLGIMQRLPQWLPMLHERLGTKRLVLSVDNTIAQIEGISRNLVKTDPVPTVKITENGIRYEVDFREGHKTGFFCDQRDNRKRLASFAPGKRVLDLCCYTGGFALSAAVTGQALEVTGVDLDEKAIAQAKRNANLNQARVTWVHCDAFSYARQMMNNLQRWDVVVLDPPKLIFSREEFAEGEQKYQDMNQLGMGLVAPGGILVTCSCSGQLSAEEFEQIVVRAAHKQGRRLQIFDRTGAGLDHPIMSNCPESRYLKVLWTRVF